MEKGGNLEDLHIFDAILSSTTLVDGDPFIYDTSDILYSQPR